MGYIGSEKIFTFNKWNVDLQTVSSVQLHRLYLALEFDEASPHELLYKNILMTLVISWREHYEKLVVPLADLEW